MPLVNDFLLKYHLGQVLLVAFVISILGALPLRSQKILSLNVIMFGLLFAVLPGSMAPPTYKYLGIALLVVGPVLFATAKR